jgi:hypothetical protein
MSFKPRAEINKISLLQWLNGFLPIQGDRREGDCKGILPNFCANRTKAAKKGPEG